MKIPESPVTIDEIKSLLEKSMDELRAMELIEFPKTIDEALTMETLGAAQIAAEYGIETLPPWKTRAGKKRCVSLAKANEILRSAESRAIHLLVQSHTAVFVQAITGPAVAAFWFVENMGLILTALSELLGRATVAIEKSEFYDRSLEQWAIRDRHLANFDFLNFWRQLGEQNQINEDLIQALIEATGSTIEEFFARIVWENVGLTIAAVGSTAAIAETIKPLSDAGKAANAQAEKSPFPQAPRKNFRRRKRSRR